MNMVSNEEKFHTWIKGLSHEDMGVFGNVIVALNLRIPPEAWGLITADEDEKSD